MAALHFWRRRKSDRQAFPPLAARRKWPGPRLEPLEDRVLLDSNPLSQPLADGLYQAVLGRTPQGNEDAGWIAALDNHTLSPTQETEAFIASPEYRAGAVTHYYQALLGRA